VVTAISLKSIITAPENGATLSPGNVAVRGAAYAGERDVVGVEVSVDDGKSWQAADFIGPHEAFAWRRWEFQWPAAAPGSHRIMSRATDSDGAVQPATAAWNVLGYGNNGVREHAVSVVIR